jgi:hypothetical protein
MLARTDGSRYRSGRRQYAARCDAADLAESRFEIDPVVDRQHCHRGVERAVGKGQSLGGPAHRRTAAALSDHLLGEFECHDAAIARFVGTRSRSHVAGRAGVAERARDVRADSRVGNPASR